MHEGEQVVATDDLQANSYYATSTFKEAFNSNFSYATSDALPTKQDSDVDEPDNETGKTSFVFVYRLCIQWTIRVFSRDILKAGILACEPVVGVLGVYYLLENIMHYYYCQSEGGEDSHPRKYPAVIVSSKF